MRGAAEQRQPELKLRTRAIPGAELFLQLDSSVCDTSEQHINLYTAGLSGCCVLLAIISRPGFSVDAFSGPGEHQMFFSDCSISGGPGSSTRLISGGQALSRISTLVGATRVLQKAPLFRLGVLGALAAGNLRLQVSKRHFGEAHCSLLRFGSTVDEFFHC